MARLDEKIWDGISWVFNGKPITYRVTWVTWEDGESHERDFTNIDSAWNFYKQKEKGYSTRQATFEHIH